MYRTQLLPYLKALFSTGRPSASDYQKLIDGLGSEADRPHIVCTATGDSIPDNLVFVTETTVPTVSTGTSNSGCCCGSSSSGSTVTPSSSTDTVANVLCDWWVQGWLLDCTGVCTGTSGAKSYYMVTSAASGVYEICSISFGNPGFDVGNISSASCVRIVRQYYTRSTGTVDSTLTTSELLLTGDVDAVTSSEVRELRVVRSTPTTFEPGVLYVELQLPRLSAPIVTLVSEGVTDISISWDAVASASGYAVGLLGGTSTVVSGLSYDMTGLGAGVSYTLSVVAVGDGVSWANSLAGVVSGTTLPPMSLDAPTLSKTLDGVVVTVVEGAASYAYKWSDGGSITVVEGSSVTGSSFVIGSPFLSDILYVKAVSTSTAILDSVWVSISLG